MCACVCACLRLCVCVCVCACVCVCVCVCACVCVCLKIKSSTWFANRGTWVLHLVGAGLPPSSYLDFYIYFRGLILADQFPLSSKADFISASSCCGVNYTQWCWVTRLWSYMSDRCAGFFSHLRPFRIDFTLPGRPSCSNALRHWDVVKYSQVADSVHARTWSNKKTADQSVCIYKKTFLYFFFVKM